MMANSARTLAVHSTPEPEQEASRRRVFPPNAAAERYRAIFANHTAEEQRALAEIKRLLERHTADAGFRRRLAEPGADQRAVAAAYGIAIDPREVASLLTPADAVEGAAAGEPGPLVRAWNGYRAEMAEVGALLVGGGDCADVNPPFHAWRRRQVHRLTSELGGMAEGINHPIMSFELTAGCSVGCWFCGISAGKLQGAFPYSAENQRLWRDVLGQAMALFGTAAQTGFCYWGTEPADNPDYPRFIADFRRLTGALPPTTSAAPLKDLAWTRRVLALHGQFGGLPNRFSILNLRMLDRVHAAFTAEELIGVHLVLQNKEAEQPKARAGRARDRAERSGKPDAGPGGSEAGGIVEGTTIACVSGFLVNMVERSIRLVSPVPASARWPLGYRIFGSRKFETAPDFRRAIEGLIAEHMPMTVAAATPLRFRRDLRYARTDDGFALTSRGTGYALAGGAATGLLGDLLQEGRSTAEDITAALALAGVDFLRATDLLQQLFDRGVLEDDTGEDSEGAMTPR